MINRRSIIYFGIKTKKKKSFIFELNYHKKLNIYLSFWEIFKMNESKSNLSKIFVRNLHRYIKISIIFKIKLDWKNTQITSINAPDYFLTLLIVSLESANFNCFEEKFHMNFITRLNSIQNIFYIHSKHSMKLYWVMSTHILKIHQNRIQAKIIPYYTN